MKKKLQIIITSIKDGSGMIAITQLNTLLRRGKKHDLKYTDFGINQYMPNQFLYFHGFNVADVLDLPKYLFCISLESIIY